MAKTHSMLSRSHVNELEARAHSLAERMPELLVEAQRAAHTISFGIHGRRRAGPGETFWQFRHFQNSDSASQVDWRRSASSDHLYIREREWEAAHTVWLWPDLSPSMQFCSHLSQREKLERALVLTLAMGDLLIRSGERVGLLGLVPPITSRNAAHRFAQAIIQNLREKGQLQSLPAKARLSPHAECLLFSDFLEPVDRLMESVEDIAAQGVRGHLVQVLDPAEETLPYEGRTEFEDVEADGAILAERAESLRDKFQQRMQSHRQQIKKKVKRLEWSFLLHHTDRPAEEPLLALHTYLSGLESNYRYRPNSVAKSGFTDSSDSHGGEAL